MLASALAVLALAAPADAVLLSCERGAAEFEARMEMVPEATQMEMRFKLRVREPGRRIRRLAAPGFGEWTTADPGVTRYVYTRRVEELIGPARYRVTVHFRWRDASGAVVARARRRSRACRQADPRPDLRLEEVTLQDGRYAVRVRNRGRGAAGPFAVRIGAAEVELDGLGARRERTVELAPPACAPLAEVDPHDAVEERSERNNARAIACP